MKAEIVRATALAAALFVVATTRGEPRLEWIDGASTSSAAPTVHSQGEVRGPGVADGSSVNDLREIFFADVAAKKRPIQATLAPEGSVGADDVLISDEKVRLVRDGKELPIRIDAIRSLRFDPTVSQPLFDKAVASPLPNSDRIFFLGEEKKLDAVNGMIESLTANELTFTWDKQTRKLPRDQVWGVVFAGTSAGKRSPVVVHLRDGAVLPGTLTALSTEAASLTVGGAKLEIPIADLARIEFRSPRVAFLSDLKPVSEEHRPLLTAPRPWQRDLAANGRPLTLIDKVYTKGVGVHSFTKLEFDADEKFDKLVGVLGIDASASGRGDCVFVVQGDGNELFSRRIRGTEPPFALQLEIRGVKRVALIVEPGADLDLADYADWCEIRFLKQAERAAKP